MKRWILPATLLVLCGGLFTLFYKGFGKDVHAVPFGMKGKPAPEFSLQDLSTGKTVSLADYKGKQPVIINFWSTWCGPCKYEHPVLEWGSRQFGDKVAFLGMVFEDTPENAREFLGRNGYNFPQLIDPNSLTAVQYGAAGVPETYFISRDGIIVDKHIGPIPPEELKRRVAELEAHP